MTIESNNARRDLVAQSGGAALGWLIGLATGDQLGTIVGAGVGETLAPAMTYYVGKVYQELTGRGPVIADAASEASGMLADEIIDQALRSDDLHPLVSRIIEAAHQTGDIRQLRAMGYLLGRAARENRANRIDEDILIVAGLGELEPASVRVLDILDGPFDPDNENAAWTSERIINAAGSELSPVGCHAALGGLLRHGLAETNSPFGSTSGYELTDYGRSMLTALRALA